MPFWPVIKMFLTFLRELIVDKADELNYSSSEFNARKATLFFFVIGLSVSVVLLMYRLVHQSMEMVELKNAIAINETRKIEETKKIIAAIKVFITYIEGLPAHVKISNPVPSDSGNELTKFVSRSERTTEKYKEEQLKAVPPPKEPELTKEQKEALLKTFLEKQQPP